MPDLQIVIKNDVLVLAAWILCWFLPQLAALLGCVSKRLFLWQHYHILGYLTDVRPLVAGKKRQKKKARHFFLKSGFFSFFSEASWWLAHLLLACFTAPLFSEVIQQYSPQDSVPFVLFLSALGYTAWWAWLSNTYLCGGGGAGPALSYATLAVVAISNCACVVLIRVTFPEHHLHHWFPLGQLVACAVACIATRQAYEFRRAASTYESSMPTSTGARHRSSSPAPAAPPLYHHHHQQTPLSLWPLLPPRK